MWPLLLQRCCRNASNCPVVRTHLAAALRVQQCRFLATSQETAPRSAAVTEAFPFLTGRSPAEASRPGSFGSLAATAFCDVANVLVIRDMDAFEAEVYRKPAQPLVIFFAAKCNTYNKQLLEQFTSIANSGSPNARFLVVDVDEVPRAAYHCGVEDVCTFVVQYNGDAFRRRIADPLGTKTPQQLAGELRAALDACLKALQHPEPPQQQVEWYSRSIPIDNLNVYRVNWPTA